MNEQKRFSDSSDEMLPGYDFSNGVPGKHFQSYRADHTVKIHQSDGATEIFADFDAVLDKVKEKKIPG